MPALNTFLRLKALLAVLITLLVAFAGFAAGGKGIYVDAQVADFTHPVVTSSSKNVFHLISHGRPGELFIDGEWLDAQGIANWLRANAFLKGKEYLNIYGCEFGKGQQGALAVAVLQDALCINIAASDDLTGYGGDWDLEIGLSPEIFCAPNWAGTLQSPGGVNTNLQRWYRGDAGVTTGATFTWADQQGIANATQGTAANQPSYSNFINFNPVVTFDGTNDRLNLANATGLPAAIIGSSVYYVTNRKLK